MWEYRGGEWTRKKVTGKDVAIGPEGSVFTLGTGASTGGYPLYKWSDERQ